MSNSVNLNSVDVEIIDTIKKVLLVRDYMHAYVEKPTDENGESIAISVDNMTNQIDNLRLSLAVMVKRVNGIDNEVVGRETDIGIHLP